MQHKNPTDQTGKVSRCVICDSTMHWRNDCPRLQMFTEELIQECYLDTVVVETCCSALLDSGCTKTVCGTKWLREYTLGLSEEDRKTIVRSKSDRIFKFGDWKVVNAYERVTIPATIGSQKGVIECEVIDKNLPLLPSKDSMKKAGVTINFVEDTATINGEKIDLDTTSSGHCIILLRQSQENILMALDM